MMSQPGQQAIAIHILPIISQSKASKATKFGLLTEYNVRDIFLEKSYTKCGGKTILGPSLKIKKWTCLWINSLKFYTVCFIVYQVQGHVKTLKLGFRPLAFTSYKAFFKNNCLLAINFIVLIKPFFLHD